MIRNGWNGLKWLEIAEMLELARNDLKWLIMAENDLNSGIGYKGLEIAENLALM